MIEFFQYFNLPQLQHFHFLRPYWLVAFIAMFFLLRFFGQRDDTLSLWKNVMSASVLKALTIKGNTGHWLSPHKLSLILSFPMCLVLMGPTWQQQPSPFSENNAALIIALDVSDTMMQADIQPSRLLRAKQKILQLLTLRGDTQTALIAFAGSAHVVMPITNDQKMIQHFLDSLEPKLMPVQGKLPESVLPITQQLLATTQVPSTLLLISDGASTETSQKFREYFQDDTLLAKHQLLIWAMGKKADQLPEDTSFVPIQFSQLNAVATSSHGRLVSMTFDEQDVEQVNRYIEHNLVTLDDKSRPWLDAGYPLTFVIATLFLFWFRRGWTLQW